MAFDLKIASPTADVQILTVSREAAAEILAADPALAHPQNRGSKLCGDATRAAKRLIFTHFVIFRPEKTLTH